LAIAVGSDPMDNLPMPNIKTFAAADVQRLRELAAEAARIGEAGPDGWSKSDCDPMVILAAFPSLRMKPGYVLRAYQFRSGGNGNGVVWAMHENSVFPQPDDCPKIAGVFLEPPKPSDALDDLMDAIDGDGSPWSYLSASMFRREISEFGAMWHGCDWGSHTILGGNPLRAKRTGTLESVSPAGNWTWKEPHPKEWKPQVVEADGAIKVTFHTYTGLCPERILRHTDSFTPGSYRFANEGVEVASAPGGYVY